MEQHSFDEMPDSLASLHDKADRILEMLTAITSGEAYGDKHILIGMSEASNLLGKSPSTIYDMTSKGRIPFHKRGNKLYFFRDELLQWIADGGRSDVVYPEAEREAERHLAEMQMNVRHKPRSLTGQIAVHNN